MKLSFVFILVALVGANNVDEFNYGYDDESIPGGQSYGQPNWGRVTCDNLGVCVSIRVRVL
jgi:hypothetical protein